MLRHPRSILLTLLLAVAAAALLVLAPPAAVSAATSNYRYRDPSSIPASVVAIVFGAGVRPDGTLTPMLADRVQAAVDLYLANRVQKLLMTGDNSHPDYNEVTAMRRFAEERGVPADIIRLDHAGFSTYESCFRARAIFGIEEAILVTQDFHLARAIYTCRQLGVDAIGLGTADWGKYSDALMTRYAAREALATLNALLQVHVTHPRPTFLGAYEGMG